MFSVLNQLVLSNKDVCKNLKLKILNFGKMADIFVMKTKFQRFSKQYQKFDFSVVFEIFLNIFFLILASSVKKGIKTKILNNVTRNTRQDRSS